ncbi:MAG TPA: ATP-binding cassette domain-containing protein [Polyangiaceae bacterium]|nr:ATP-binding cassette domain-containing protein [Polyangiaceae bacterium]
MASIQVNDVTKIYGQKKLFREVTVTFGAGRRYGITGPNGAGKSTFLKILSGELEADTGSVSRPERTSVLKQDQFGFESWRVLDVVIMGNARLWATLEEKAALLTKTDLTEAEGNLLGELECVIAEEQGYSAESDAAELLNGLGIEESDHERCMSELPGGRKLRVLLAQALFGSPDALLLDEPTNNLDIDSIRWLERFLSNYRGVLLTVSHDRHFLNEICTHIADIDYETIITYPGGYDDMVRAKGQIRGKVEQQNSERQKKIEQLQDFVARFGAGTRASQVQSRKRQIDRLTLTDLKRSNIERPFIQFTVKKPSSKQTLVIEGLTKRWPECNVCEDFRATITKGEKIAIIGRTGVGKTTLCKMLMEELRPDAGSIEWGTQTSIGYLAQDHRDGIESGTDITSWLHGFDPNASLQDVRGLLGRMLFKGEEGTKPTDALSGGEAVRLIFSKLMLMKDNVLILDEPTNHLDLESIVALGDALEKYEGTAFVVTHDRDLVTTFATRIFAFTEEGLVDWQGSYDDFVERGGGLSASTGSKSVAPKSSRDSKAPAGNFVVQLG